MAWPKLTKNASFGPNLVVFRQIIQNFTGKSKSFGTNISKKTNQGTLFALFFGWAMDEMGKKCEYLAENDQKCILNFEVFE